jgi:pyruvate dehydrogenase E1 component alpha subunit
MHLTTEDLAAIYERMALIRRFETTAVALIQNGKLVGHLHPSSGQEAVSVGVCFRLHATDYVMTTHRPHGHYIAKGGDLNALMAELHGKTTGCCKGKGGSMHVADMAAGVLPATAIVGGGTPIAVGVALACKLLGLPRVTVCFFGEGAMNEGVVAESVNMATIWGLPVIFVCENNRYAVSTAITTSSVVEEMGARVAWTGMPVYVVDGNDVLSVLETAEKAIERARRGDGPSFVECKTFKHRDTAYALRLPVEELAEWKQRDPLPRLARHIMTRGLLSAYQLSDIDSRADELVKAAVSFADSSPEPIPSMALEQLFAE